MAVSNLSARPTELFFRYFFSAVSSASRLIRVTFSVRSTSGTIDTTTSAASRAVTIRRRGIRATPIQRQLYRASASQKRRVTTSPRETRTRRTAPGRSSRTATRPSRSAFLSAPSSVRRTRPPRRGAAATAAREARTRAASASAACGREARACDGQAERREEPPRDGLAVLQPVARGRLERVPRRVAEVQRGPHGPCARKGPPTRPTPSPGGSGEPPRRPRPARGAASGPSSRAIARWKSASRKDVLTTSARPDRNARSGSVSRTVVSARTRRGAWNAPARFLPCGRSTAVFPPSALSASREERRRRLHDGDAAQRERRGQTGHVAHRPAAERDDSPVAAQAAADELLDELAQDVPGLRPLAVGDEERILAQDPLNASS